MPKLNRKQLAEVMNIDNKCFDNPWSTDEFVNLLRGSDAFTSIARNDDNFAVGFLVYTNEAPECCHIHNMGVLPSHQRTGVGSMLVMSLMNHVIAGRCKRVMLNIRETNLDGQLFFKALGFRAIATLRDHYLNDDYSEEDAYMMTFQTHNTINKLESVR